MLTLETLARNLASGPPGPRQVCLHPDDWKQLLSDSGAGRPFRMPLPRKDGGVAATWSPVRMRFGKVNRSAAWDRFLIQVYGESVGLVCGMDVYLDSTLQRGEFTIHYAPDLGDETKWEPREPEEDSRSSRSL